MAGDALSFPQACLVCRRRMGPALRLLDNVLCEECLEMLLDAGVDDAAYALLIDQLRVLWTDAATREDRRWHD